MAQKTPAVETTETAKPKSKGQEFYELFCKARHITAKPWESLAHDLQRSWKSIAAHDTVESNQSEEPVQQLQPKSDPPDTPVPPSDNNA